MFTIVDFNNFWSPSGGGLRNKLCITDMTIEEFSKLLADWTEVMTGKTIGEFE